MSNPRYPRPDTELDELLGAYALDALDGREREEVEQYLERSPRARDEVAHHLEVASFLGNIGGEAPLDLWDRIEAQLTDRISVNVPPTVPTLRFVVGDEVLTTPGVGSTPLPDSIPPSRFSKEARQKPTAWRRWPVVAMGIAAAVTSVLGLTIARQNARIDRLTRQSYGPRVDAVLGAAGTREATLASTDGRVQIRAIIATDGEAYLVGQQLPALAPGHTYQLWGIKGDRVLSLGILGRSFKIRSFTADEAWTQLAVTDEAAPGVVSTTHVPIVAGNVV